MRINANDSIFLELPAPILYELLDVKADFLGTVDSRKHPRTHAGIVVIRGRPDHRDPMSLRLAEVTEFNGGSQSGPAGTNDNAVHGQAARAWLRKRFFSWRAVFQASHSLRRGVSDMRWVSTG